jgi:hypothetical protein
MGNIAMAILQAASRIEGVLRFVSKETMVPWLWAGSNYTPLSDHQDHHEDKRPN